MRLSRILPVLAILGLAACDSDPVTPEVDLDATLDLMATSGIGAYASSAASADAGVAGSITSASSNSDAASCSYNASSQFFVCAPVTVNGITVSRSFQLLDASGAAMSTPSPTALASLRAIVDIEGTILPTSTTPSTIEIDRHEDATLSGLRTANRVLNGSATQRLSISGTDGSIVSHDTATTTSLQLPASADQKYPLGGKITVSGTTDFSNSGMDLTIKRLAEITFDGTSIMTVKTTVGASTTTCKIDLANSNAQPVCS